jgi:hypothetical protein
MAIELFEIFAWHCAVAACLIMAVMFFLESRKRTGFSKPFFRAVGIFGLFYGIARLFENIRRYFIGSYNDIAEAWMVGEQIAGLNLTFRLLYVIISFIGIIYLYYNIERYIFTNNRYIVTIFSVIQAFFSVIVYIYFHLIFFYLAVAIFIIPCYFLPILFLDAARKAPSKYIRNGCISTAVGMIVFTTAIIIDLPEGAFFVYYFNWPHSQSIVRLIAPILLILGVIIVTIGLKTHFREPRITIPTKREVATKEKESSEDIESKLVDLAEKKGD